MPVHNTIILEFMGNTAAAPNTPLNLGAIGNVGAYIIGGMVSWSVAGALIVPNQIRVQYGGAGAPPAGVGIISSINAPTAIGWAILPDLKPSYAGGIPITAAANNIWVTTIHSGTVWNVITLVLDLV